MSKSIAHKVQSAIEDAIHGKTHATLKEINLYLICRDFEDFTACHSTRLYNRYGYEYCEMVSAVAMIVRK